MISLVGPISKIAHTLVQFGVISIWLLYLYDNLLCPKKVNRLVGQDIQVQFNGMTSAAALGQSYVYGQTL